MPNRGAVKSRVTPYFAELAAVVRDRWLRCPIAPPLPMNAIPPTRMIALSAACTLLLAPLGFGQGPLTPPGAPAPTMKTLDQIASTGIAINSTNTPGNATSVFVISAPGSYYLTDNVEVLTGKNGILITAGNVTIDLNGYGVFGDLAGLSGITDGGTTLTGVTIRHGTVQAWTIAGVDLSHSFDCVVSGLIVNFCTGVGLTLGDATVVRDCMVRNSSSDNFKTGFNANITHCTAVGSSAGSGFNLGQDSAITGCVANFNKTGILAAFGCSVSQCTTNQNSDHGILATSACRIFDCLASLNGGAATLSAIEVGFAATISNCTASNNTAQYAILAGAGSVVVHCTASGNTSSQSVSAGIRADECTVKDCNASFNSTSNATASNSTGMGICAFDENALIENCTCGDNAADGIQVSSRSVVLNSLSGSNGGAGVHATGTANRIEGNQVTSNNPGILVDTSVNLILRNTARANGSANYVIAINNRVAAIVTPTLNAAPINGNTGGFAFGTDASANIAY
jgi:parallel beta-helix repeat protein